MIPFARRTVAEPIQGTKVMMEAMMSDRLSQMPLGMRLIINDAHVHMLMHTCTIQEWPLLIAMARQRQRYSRTNRCSATLPDSGVCPASLTLTGSVAIEGDIATQGSVCCSTAKRMECAKPGQAQRRSRHSRQGPTGTRHRHQKVQLALDHCQPIRSFSHTCHG